MRDDILIIWPHKQELISEAVKEMNTIEERIQVTYELEREGKKLPFLDMWVIREGSRIITDVYRKPTHTEVYINAKSYHPMSIKLGALKGLIRRAERLCSKPEFFERELDHLTDVFVANGYELKLIKRTIERYVNRNRDDKRERSPFLLWVPYINVWSDKLKRDLLKLDVEIAFKRGKSLRSTLSKLKPKREYLDLQGAVYCVQCTECEQIYIGETSRAVNVRLQEHRNCCRRGDEKNGIFDHMARFDHKIDFKSTVILTSESRVHHRKTQESLYIKAMDYSQTLDGIMNLEQGRNFHESWNPYLPRIRKEVLETLGRNKPDEEDERDDEDDVAPLDSLHALPMPDVPSSRHQREVPESEESSDEEEVPFDSLHAMPMRRCG